MKSFKNIVDKGENYIDQHAFLSPECFLKFSFSKLLKIRIIYFKLGPDMVFKKRYFDK